MGWDSNPRYACTYGGFQDRCLKPLGHPSEAGGRYRHAPAISTPVSCDHVRALSLTLPPLSLYRCPTPPEKHGLLRAYVRNSGGRGAMSSADASRARPAADHRAGLMLGLANGPFTRTGISSAKKPVVPDWLPITRSTHSRLRSMLAAPEMVPIPARIRRGATRPTPARMSSTPNRHDTDVVPVGLRTKRLTSVEPFSITSLAIRPPCIDATAEIRAWRAASFSERPAAETAIRP